MTCKLFEITNIGFIGLISTAYIYNYQMRYLLQNVLRPCFVVKLYLIFLTKDLYMLNLLLKMYSGNVSKLSGKEVY